MQTPASFEYERATSVEGAIASLQRLGSDARVIAGGHSLLPMMKLRLANPEHLIDINDLTELSYIREQADEIRIGALTRHVDLLKSDLLARALPAVPRRRERDRRPGRAQPRHDRRLALPGRRRGGPVGRLLGRQGEGRDPRRRRRARRRDGRLPRRALHDRGRRRRAAHRGADPAAPGRGQRAREGRAPRRRLGDRGRVRGGLDRRRPDHRRRASRSARSGSRRSTSRAPRSSCAARLPRTSSSRRRARSPRRTAPRPPTAGARSTTSATSPAFSQHAPCGARPRARSPRRPEHGRLDIDQRRDGLARHRAAPAARALHPRDPRASPGRTGAATPPTAAPASC